MMNDSSFHREIMRKISKIPQDKRLMFVLNELYYLALIALVIFGFSSFLSYYFGLDNFFASSSSEWLYF